jgi:hypothetical protein
MRFERVMQRQDIAGDVVIHCKRMHSAAMPMIVNRQRPLMTDSYCVSQ